MADSSILSTHVLDVAQGVPARGVSVEPWRLEPAEGMVARTATAPDGRADDPLPPPAAFAPGRYELRFDVGEYFRHARVGADPPFHDVVAMRISLAADREHYHVPLLCSPWGYTTYRGS